VSPPADKKSTAEWLRDCSDYPAEGLRGG